MEIYRAIPCKYFCIFSKLLTSVYFASISYNSLPVFSMQFLLHCQYIWFYSIWRFALVRVSLRNNLQLSATESCVNYSNETSTQNKFKGLFCACCLQIFIYIRFTSRRCYVGKCVANSWFIIALCCVTAILWDIWSMDKLYYYCKSIKQTECMSCKYQWGTS